MSVRTRTHVVRLAVGATGVVLSNYLYNRAANDATVLGCLLNMAGKLQRQGRSIRVRHVAEVLADVADELPPIGAPADSGER